MKYAANTDVSPEKSRAEIEKILMRFGATGFAYGWEGQNAALMFVAKNRQVRFVLPMPDKKHKTIIYTETGRFRSEGQIEFAYQQSIRQRWRALALAIKAKLECVDTGITEFEDEFLSHIVLPSGKTTGEWMKPQIAIAYSKNEMPLLLCGPTS